MPLPTFHSLWGPPPVPEHSKLDLEGKLNKCKPWHWVSGSLVPTPILHCCSLDQAPPHTSLALQTIGQCLSFTIYPLSPPAASPNPCSMDHSPMATIQGTIPGAGLFIVGEGGEKEVDSSLPQHSSPGDQFPDE